MVPHTLPLGHCPERGQPLSTTAVTLVITLITWRTAGVHTSGARWPTGGTGASDILQSPPPRRSGPSVVLPPGTHFRSRSDRSYFSTAGRRRRRRRSPATARRASSRRAHHSWRWALAVASSRFCEEVKRPSKTWNGTTVDSLRSSTRTHSLMGPPGFELSRDLTAFGLVECESSAVFPHVFARERSDRAKSGMGPPGFEPGSRAPKARSIPG